MRAAADSAGDYTGGAAGDLLGVGRLDEAARLHRQRATLRRLLDELEAGMPLVPSDAGTFWRSDAHDAYAARLQELRRLLAHAHARLIDALSSIEAALAALAAREDAG